MSDEIADAIAAVAHQLRIANALELVRLSAVLGWNSETTVRVANSLHVNIESINQESSP